MDKRFTKIFYRWLLKRHDPVQPGRTAGTAKPEKRLPAQVFSEDETRQVLQSLDITRLLACVTGSSLRCLGVPGSADGAGEPDANGMDTWRGVVNVRQGKGHRIGSFRWPCGAGVAGAASERRGHRRHARATVVICS